MDPAPRPPQPPRLDRAWADPLILTLTLLAVLLGSATLRHRGTPRPAPARVSLGLRLQEARFLASRVLPLPAGRLAHPQPWPQLLDQARTPWDRAFLALHAAEAGEALPPDALRDALPPSGAATLRRAYGQGPEPGPDAIREVRAALQGTAAAELLAARLEEAEGRPGQASRAGALDLARRRLLTLAAFGSTVALLALGGLGFAVFLALTSRRPPASRPWQPPLEGRALALALLGWFNLLLTATTLVQPLTALLPAPWRPLGLTLAYTLHALGGLGCWLRLSGHTFRGLVQTLCPSSWPRVLGRALGFLGLAVAAVALVGLLASPLLRNRPHAQGELLEGFAAPHPWPVTLALFLTVAVLAPAFEELTFRGFLQPWLGHRLRPWAGGLLAALAFGASHLLPTALPTLTTLGLVLGLAFARTGDLRTAILVHGAWNGGIFVAVRLLLG